MPTYDYECSACGGHVEIFQKITDDPVKKCPACGKKKLVRQFGTGAAIVFKGSGFYQTDYRSEGYRKSAESDKKSAESGGAPEKSGNSSAAESSKPAADKPATEPSGNKPKTGPKKKSGD